MSIRSFLYRLARLLGDVQAHRAGEVIRQRLLPLHLQLLCLKS